MKKYVILGSLFVTCAVMSSEGGDLPVEQRYGNESLEQVDQPDFYALLTRGEENPLESSALPPYSDGVKYKGTSNPWCRPTYYIPPASHPTVLSPTRTNEYNGIERIGFMTPTQSRSFGWGQPKELQEGPHKVYPTIDVEEFERLLSGQTTRVEPHYDGYARAGAQEATGYGDQQQALYPEPSSHVIPFLGDSKVCDRAKLEDFIKNGLKDDEKISWEQLLSAWFYEKKEGKVRWRIYAQGLNGKGLKEMCTTFSFRSCSYTTLNEAGKIRLAQVALILLDWSLATLHKFPNKNREELLEERDTSQPAIRKILWETLRERVYRELINGKDLELCNILVDPNAPI